MRSIAWMSNRMSRWGSVVVATALMLGVGWRAVPQQSGQNYGPPPIQQRGLPGLPGTPRPGGDDTINGPGKQETERARMMRDERHKRLAADTDRLLQLANELKVEVDKASKDDLSLTVINKATEIEKLAHDVREREKD
jgi:hypothetical protein